VTVFSHGSPHMLNSLQTTHFLSSMDTSIGRYFLIVNPVLWLGGVVVTAMLLSVDHLISCLDGTVMSIGQSSSSHAHLQTFQHYSCRPLCIWYCVVIVSV